MTELDEEFTELLEKNEHKLLKDIELAIKECEKKCNKYVVQHNIKIGEILPANTDYLKAVVMSYLFEDLHRSNKDVAKFILTNMAGQAGLYEDNTHVELTPSKQD